MRAIVVMDAGRRGDELQLAADTHAVNLTAARLGLKADQVIWTAFDPAGAGGVEHVLKTGEMTGVPVIVADERVLSPGQLRALDEAGMPLIFARRSGPLAAAPAPAEKLGAGPYDLVIGLGPVCATAYRMRRHLGLRRAYPFDWMGVQATSLARVLRARFEVEFTAENILEWEKLPRNRKFLTSHNHEFPYDEDGRPIIDGPHLQKAAQRMAYLAGRFFHDCKAARNIAFVMGEPQPRYYFDTQPPPVDFTDICDALGEVCGGAFRLFVVGADADKAPGPDEPRTTWVPYTDHGDPSEGLDWTESERGWREALAVIFGAEAVVA